MNKYLPVTLFLFTFFCLLFTSILHPSILCADTLGTTKVYYTTGKKSQTDNIEDRDLSGSFSSYKYGISVSAEPQQDFHYRIGSQDYKKDFETAYNSLDNRTNIYDANLSLPIFKTDRTSFRFNTDYGLRTKRYKNSPSLEYDKNSISGAIDASFDKNYSLELSGGIRDYDYIKSSSSNQLKSFFKAAPSVKFLNEKVTVSGYYKRDWIDQAQNKKDYTEDTLSVNTALKLDTPFIYKLIGRFGYGRNDTRDSDEDREDSLRFEYKLWDVTSYYRFKKTLDTQFTYGQKYRDYFTSINSYDNWFISNKTTVALFLKDPFNLDLLLGGEHKQTKFYENESLTYNKNVLSGGFNILKRADWSFKPEFKFTKYDYDPDSTRNEKQYKLDLSFKKYIGSTDNAFEVGYWYQWKDYKYKKEIEQWFINVSYAIKF